LCFKKLSRAKFFKTFLGGLGLAPSGLGGKYQRQGIRKGAPYNWLPQLAGAKFRNISFSYSFDFNV
jgi:hypothetical protein